MKRALLLLSLLLLLLVPLVGCSAAEAKEPVPDWPERLMGTYDQSLTFRFNGSEPEASGVDSQTRRMTALFDAKGGTLALSWRRLEAGEVELMEEFLAGTGVETGGWERDAGATGALDCYLRLGRNWYCLSASCKGLEEAALLRLVDGAVEAAAENETALPRASSSLWQELLPWEEEWTCLLLGNQELRPEPGKEALRALLYSYDWALVDAGAEEGEYHPSIGVSTVPTVRQTSIYLDETLTRETVPIRFHLRSNGDLYMDGVLRRPLGEGAGEQLLAAWTALSETGVKTLSPPRLTLTSGTESIEAILWGTFSWSYTTRIGGGMTCESYGVWYQDFDWLGQGAPILTAAGPVKLRFGPVGPDAAEIAPDRMRLAVFSEGSEQELPLEDGCFTPLEGLRTYILSCSWKRPPEEPGGSGSCGYILLIDGVEKPEAAGG